MPNHYIPIHPDNVNTRDWLILLEVGTLVGDAPHNIRVAKATLEKTIVKKYDVFLRKKYFIVLDGYDVQIHVLYFCPQLYKRDMEGVCGLRHRFSQHRVVIPQQRDVVELPGAGAG